MLDYLDAMTALGHRLLGLLALGLGLDADWFDRDLTADPPILFRIFRYPPGPTADGAGLGRRRAHRLRAAHDPRRRTTAAGSRCDGPDGWIDVPPMPGAFVCNLGDMLERMTGGRYRSTPHRVRNATQAETASRSRSSSTRLGRRGPARPAAPTPARRTTPAPLGRRRRPRLDGTYGDYLLGKVAKVFPDLFDDVRLGRPSNLTRRDHLFRSGT